MRELDLKERNLRRICKRKFKEFNLRKKQQNRNSIRKERLSKTLSLTLTRRQLKWKETELSYQKSTKILRNSKRILLETMSKKSQGSEKVMSSSPWLYKATKLQFKKKLKNGEESIMKSKGNTLILQILLIVKELFGMVNSSSSNNKEIQPKKILMMLRESSNQLLSNYRNLNKNLNLRVKPTMP